MKAIFLPVRVTSPEPADKDENGALDGSVLSP